MLEVKTKICLFTQGGNITVYYHYHYHYHYHYLLSLQAAVFIPSQRCLETPQKVIVMMKDVTIMLIALATKRKVIAVFTTIMVTKERVPQG